MVQYDPETLQTLDRRYWYGLAAGLAILTVALVAAVVRYDPAEPWLVVLVGLVAIVTLGVATTSLALGDRLDAAGLILATVGWVTMAAVVTDLSPAPDSIYAAIVLFLVGGSLSLWADYGDRVRAAVGG